MESQYIKILSVEDNPGDVRLLQEILKGEKSIRFEWVSAASLMEAITVVSESHFDVILLDLSLPDSLGMQTLISIKPYAPDVPVIIMTGLDNEQTALEALEKGAQDYLVKGQVDGNTLGRVIRYAIHRKQAQEALRESEERYILAVQGSNNGLWDWDLKTNSIYFSPRWKDILGYAENEIGNNPEEWMSRIHEEDIVLVRDSISEHITNQIPCVKVEYRMRHKTDGWSWILTQGVAVRDAQGNAYRMAGSQTDVTAQKNAEEKLLYNAFHDHLTGLPSRALIMNRISRAMKRLDRVPNYCFAVLFLDLDRFKVVNDSLGHTLGDQLLVGVGQRLLSCLRKVDTIARIGGDEFIILTDHMKNSGDAMRVAERIKQALNASFNVDGHEVFTRASIGIALCSSDYKSPEEMVRDADTAMYHAKSLGGCAYQLFNRNMHTTAVELLELENSLRRAVNNSNFVLHYQPVASMETGKIVGVEALIRWMHPEKGLLMPGSFISLAEETGLIVPMGEWVLKAACTQLSRWQKQFPSTVPLSISVNVSFKQFVQVGFVDIVDRVIRETGIQPNSLCLEITESGMMKSPDLIIPLLAQLKKRSVQIHLDDFGTGYSSLYYLHQFKIDKLKIDRSFVSHIQAGDKNFEVLKSIVSLAHNLKIEIVAEGIETAVQMECLKELKCQYGQGYFFSKPKDSGMITDLIAKNPNVLKGEFA